MLHMFMFPKIYPMHFGWHITSAIKLVNSEKQRIVSLQTQCDKFYWLWTFTSMG